MTDTSPAAMLACWVRVAGPHIAHGRLAAWRDTNLRHAREIEWMRANAPECGPEWGWDCPKRLREEAAEIDTLLMEDTRHAA